VFKIRGILWNSNGFKDPKKPKFISDLTIENNLDFIAVSETRRSEFFAEISQKPLFRKRLPLA
jgi:hypothetical protein